MSTFTALTVRLACNQASRDLLRNAVMQEAIVFYKDQQASVECALFTGEPSEATFADIGNVTEGKLTLRRGTPVGKVLLIKTTTAIKAATYAEWIDGASQHFSIELSAAALDLSVPSCGELNLHGTISVVADGKEVTVGQFVGVLSSAGSDIIGTAATPMISNRLNSITRFAGTRSNELGSVPTTDKVAGTNEPYFIRLNGQFVTVYLENGPADDTDEGQLNPVDYDADTNNKHWVRGL